MFPPLDTTPKVTRDDGRNELREEMQQLTEKIQRREAEMARRKPKLARSLSASGHRDVDEPLVNVTMTKGEANNWMQGERPNQRVVRDNPYGKCPLPVFKGTDDWEQFSRDFREEMEVANMLPSQQLCYLKRAIPEEGANLLRYGNVRDIGHAWEMLTKHYHPLQSYTEVQEEFLNIRQRPDEAIDTLTARLMSYTNKYDAFFNRDMGHVAREKMVLAQLVTAVTDKSIAERLDEFPTLQAAVDFAEKRSRTKKRMGRPEHHVRQVREEDRDKDLEKGEPNGAEACVLNEKRGDEELMKPGSEASLVELGQQIQDMKKLLENRKVEEVLVRGTSTHIEAEPSLMEMAKQLLDLRKMVEGLMTRREGRSPRDLRCFNCQKMGHMARECTAKRNRGRWTGPRDTRRDEAQRPTALNELHQ